MSAIGPLQTSLKDVIGSWSDSWEAVSRSICSGATAPYQYWMSVPVAQTSMGAVCIGRGSDAVRVGAVLMYRPVWVSRCHWRHGLRALFHHRSEVGVQCLIKLDYPTCRGLPQRLNAAGANEVLTRSSYNFTSERRDWLLDSSTSARSLRPPGPRFHNLAAIRVAFSRVLAFNR